MLQAGPGFAEDFAGVAEDLLIEALRPRFDLFGVGVGSATGKFNHK